MKSPRPASGSVYLPVPPEFFLFNFRVRGLYGLRRRSSEIETERDKGDEIIGDDVSESEDKVRLIDGTRALGQRVQRCENEGLGGGVSSFSKYSISVIPGKAKYLSEGEAERVGMNDPYASLCSSCGISMLRGGLEDNNFEDAGAEMVRLCEDRCKDMFVLYRRVRFIYKEGQYSLPQSLCLVGGYLDTQTCFT